MVSFTASDDNLTITTIDASNAAADGVVISVADLGATTSITLGAGDATLTLSDNGDTVTGGSGDVQYFLTAGAAHTITAGSGVDTFEAVGADATVITGFTVGTDKIELDNSVLEAIDGTNLVDGNGDDISAINAVVIDDVDTSADYTMDTASTVLRLDGVYIDAAAVDAELIDATSGLQESNFAAADDIVVIWSDGANAHISLVAIDTAGGADEVDAVTVNDMIVLAGVDYTTLTALDFNSVFTA